MAKVNFGPLANDARGKINGIVYSKNKSGAYTRKKVTPANPNTSPQSAVRTNFAELAQAWSNRISDSDRATWNTYAATYPRLDIFGASIVLSGFNMFISLNQVLRNLGLPFVNTAPASNVVAPISIDPTSLEATAGTPGMGFDETGAAADADHKLYIFASRPLPPGRQPQKNDFRFLVTKAGVAGPYPAQVDMLTDYTGKYGALVAGQRVSLLVATVDTTSGLTTVGAVLTTLVAA